jgi:hypothetical protein
MLIRWLNSGRVALGCSAVVALFAAPAALAQTKQMGSEHFTAFAVDISNMAPRANTTTVDIAVSRWSTDEERDRLITVFKEKGENALLETLQKLPVVGYITTPGSLRYDLHFARQVGLPEGGRKIILLTDRFISYWEAVNRPRSIDYPFMLIQLQLDKSDRGVGKASIATKITQGKDGVIELENFASQPVILNEVRKVE